jgi:hypothetical protein
MKPGLLLDQEKDPEVARPLRLASTLREHEIGQFANALEPVAGYSYVAGGSISL